MRVEGLYNVDQLTIDLFLVTMKPLLLISQHSSCTAAFVPTSRTPAGFGDERRVKSPVFAFKAQIDPKLRS